MRLDVVVGVVGEAEEAALGIGEVGVEAGNPFLPGKKKFLLQKAFFFLIVNVKYKVVQKVFSFLLFIYYNMHTTLLGTALD